MALLIEMVVDLSMNWAEFLQRLHASKPLHGPFPSSKRLMRILRAIVEPTTDLLPVGIADLFHRRGIRAKTVGDDAPRSAIFLHDAPEKLQRRSLVPLHSDDRFQNFAFMIDGAPGIAKLAVDLHERLIQMPTPLRIAAHVRYPLLSDLGSKHRAKPVPPKSHRLMANVDPRDPRRCAAIAGTSRPSSRPDGSPLASC